MLRPNLLVASLIAFGALLPSSAARADGPYDHLGGHAADTEYGPGRAVTLELNPVAFLIQNYGGAVELMMSPDHHALIVSLHYDRMNAVPFPDTRFHGLGSEIGYRYYSGFHGPRGLFIGPSLLAGGYLAVPLAGDNVTFATIGGAIDVGYQAIVRDVTFAIGTGIQYTRPTKSAGFEGAEYPVAIYTNGGLHPRILASIGYAF